MRSCQPEAGPPRAEKPGIARLILEIEGEMAEWSNATVLKTVEA